VSALRLSRLASRDRRALLLGAALLVPVLLFKGVVHPYARARAALGERLRAQRELLERERTVLADVRRLPERRARVEALLAADAPLLFPGGDPFAATAELVGYVGEAARQSHVLVQELQSRSTAPLKGTETLVQLQVEVRGQSDFEGTLRFLQALERGPRLVRVEALAVERLAAASGGRAEALSLRAAVSAYVGATAPSPANQPPPSARVRRTSL